MPDAFQYTLSYDHRDLFVSLPESAALETIEFLQNTPPPSHLFEALDYFCQRFFPDIHEDERPWVLHRNLAKAAQSIDGDLQQVGQTAGTGGAANTNADHRALEGLRAKVFPRVRSWPLAWYWKAIFPGLPGLLRKDKTLPDTPIIVRLSQIRQWVLAVVYKEDDTKDKHGQPVVQQTLVRPPLLGRSDRITLWDNYLTLIQTPHIATTVEEKWKQVHDSYGGGPRLDEELWYVIGRHDIFYEIRPNEIRDTVDGELTLDIEVKFEIDPQNAEDWEAASLDFHDEPQIGKAKKRLPSATAIRYPHDLVKIPCFQDLRGNDLAARSGLPHEDAFLKPEYVLLASDKVCHAYERLTEVWNDKTTKSVLIVAPSGSGKELLARSNHLFQKRDGAYISYALSPSSHDTNDHTIFSRDLSTMFSMSPDISAPIVKEAEGLRNVFRETREWEIDGKEPRDEDKDKDKKRGFDCPFHWPSDGLIFRARKGTLFLDEIDKVPEQTRSSLLRLLENDEFAVYGTPMRLKLKRWVPLYVFVGSKPLAEILRLPPEDFWNRMFQRIVMEHPLEVDDPLEQQRIARSYFHFFWLRQVRKFFEMSGLLPYKYAKKKVGTAKFSHRYYLGLFRMMTRSKEVDSIATMFAEEVCTTSEATPVSIRNIKVAASRVIYSFVDYFLYGKSRHTALQKLRERVVEAQSGNVWLKDKKWFDLIGALITRETDEATESDDEMVRARAEVLTSLGEELRIEVRDIIHVAVERALN